MIDLSGEQSFGRPVQLQVTVELAFRQFRVLWVFTAANIGQQAILFINAFDLERPAFVTAYGVAGCKHDAR